MIINNEKIEFLERRLDELYDQVSRIKVCLQSIKEGNELDMDFEDKIYMEMAEEKEAIKSHAARVMEHLLKLKYCTNNMNYNVWINSVVLHQLSIIEKTKYFKKNRNTEFVKHYEETFTDAYENAVDMYSAAAINFDDLRENKKFISALCPWKPDDILTKPIWWLIDQLQDPDHMGTQMQLYPFCYYQDYDAIRGKLCAMCKSFFGCLEKYYDKDTKF